MTASASASAGRWNPASIDEIAFTNLANGRTFDFDHIDLSTTDFQMLQYTGLRENTNNFQYFQGDVRATYRTHGEPISVLS